MTGLGCGAAVPVMRLAKGMIAENPEAVVVTVAIEICSAAFYVEDDFGVLISTCIFGDGAAAAVWSGSGGDWQVDDFKSLHVPEEREKIRFTNAGGQLRNQLHKTVPKLAGGAAANLYEQHLSEGKQYDAWITHGGGRNVIQELEAQLPGLPDEGLKYARDIMDQYGNMSSPSVLFALEEFLKDKSAVEKSNTAWLCSFGAGFSAHSCTMSKI